MNTISERNEGIRFCVSLAHREQFMELEHRLKIFNEHYGYLSQIPEDASPSLIL